MLTPLLLLVLTPQQPGNLAGAPVTMFVDAETARQNDLTTHRPYLKRAGTSTVKPLDHPSGLGDRPDFRIAPWIVANVEIDAFSTNVNWIASDDYGYAWAGADGGTRWAGVVWSVDRDTQGSAASTIRLAKAGGHHAGDLFTYLFPDSKGVDPSLVNKTMLSVDDRDMRLEKETANHEMPDVVAMDLIVPILIGEPNTFGQVIGEFQGVIFSVTSATASNGFIPGSWLQTLSGSVQPSGAVVFFCPWSLLTGWGDVGVFLEPARLELDPTHDVTALSWDSEPSRNRMLFASNRPGDDPIRFLSLKSNLTSPTVFMIKGTQDPVSKRAGFEQQNQGSVGRTQALCSIDPRIPDFDKLLADYVSVPERFGDAAVWRDPGAGSGVETYVATIQADPSALAASAVLWEHVIDNDPIIVGVIPQLSSNQLSQFSWPAPAITTPGLEYNYGFTLHDSSGGIIGISNLVKTIR